jgi:hypothetical protein
MLCLPVAAFSALQGEHRLIPTRGIIPEYLLNGIYNIYV